MSALPRRAAGKLTLRDFAWGMLGKLKDVLARHAINIAVLYYETRGDVG
jgi:hypothetical protein